MLLKIKYFIVLIIAITTINVHSQTQEGVIAVEASSEIKTLIKKKIAYNAKSKTIDGFRIQLFYGSESGVRRNRNKFATLHPNTATYVDFDSPDWKLRVGNYKTRIEAERALKKIRVNFSYAYIMKFKVRL